jgi:hypothetical protein
MFGHFIWYAGLTLELMILVRASWTHLYTRFPIFYAYLACVFVSSSWLLVPYAASLRLYEQNFWAFEAVTILMGCGVLVEIMHRTLEDYRGADRLARFLALLTFFVVFGWLLLSLAFHKNPVAIADWRNHVDALERDVRIVQAVFLGITMAVALYFRIELGRNLRGLILGFGTFVGVSVISQALSFYIGKQFLPVSEKLQPCAYLFALGVWLVALWQEDEVRSRPPNPGIDDGDYERMALQTRKKLREVRSRVMPAEGQ